MNKYILVNLSLNLHGCVLYFLQGMLWGESDIGIGVNVSVHPWYKPFAVRNLAVIMLLSKNYYIVIGVE